MHRKPYIPPQSETVCFAPRINSVTDTNNANIEVGDNEAWLNFGSGYIDPSKAQGKGTDFFDDDDDGMQTFSFPIKTHSLWEDNE